MKVNIVALLTMLLFGACSERPSKGLIDDFDRNKIGWIEERTIFHDLFIQDGKYIMENKDSTSALSSTRYLDKSWHVDLANSYSVSSSISITGNENDTLSCGLILECNSYIYELTFYESGNINITEYNYHNKETLHMNNLDSLNATNKFDVTVNIDDWDFELVINQKSIGKGRFRCKTWDRIVPFTGKFTKSEIEYFKLQEK